MVVERSRNELLKIIDGVGAKVNHTLQENLRSLSGVETTSSHPPVNIPLHIPFLNRIAFVKFFFTLRQPDLTFGMSTLGEVDAIRHNSQTFFIYAPFYLFEFRFVEQQFARPFSFVLEHARIFIFVDVEVFDIKFSMIKNTPGITHIGLSKAKGFHLSAL